MHRPKQALLLAAVLALAGGLTVTAALADSHSSSAHHQGVQAENVTVDTTGNTTTIVLENVNASLANQTVQVSDFASVQTQSNGVNQSLLEALSALTEMELNASNYTVESVAAKNPSMSAQGVRLSTDGALHVSELNASADRVTVELTMN